MCIQWTQALYSVVITRQSNSPISQFNSLCNEFTSFWSMFIYNTKVSNKVTSNCFILCTNKAYNYYFYPLCMFYLLQILHVQRSRLVLVQASQPTLSQLANQHSAGRPWPLTLVARSWPHSLLAVTHWFCWVRSEWPVWISLLLGWSTKRKIKQH